MHSANNLQNADCAYITTTEQLLLLRFVRKNIKRALILKSFYVSILWNWWISHLVLVTICEHNFPTLEEISAFKARKRPREHCALKKSFHIFFITTRHSVIICMHNRLQLLADTVKSEHGGQQGVRANKQPSLTCKHKFKSHGLCIT